ncbi:hypothetical protein BJ875DRAFT_483491 [Amylocarpus encephaloides]|uniref:RGS domain-containing protein n=1 Tax=Amylocarpus encephaloides TaxID=45428 RepID=A0A9P7YL85_9HELO|nr:hypothetical protein BJ875DRAFT_483491 [Amylocarpus encephaloides]
MPRSAVHDSVPPSIDEVIQSDTYDSTIPPPDIKQPHTHEHALATSLNRTQPLPLPSVASNRRGNELYPAERPSPSKQRQLRQASYAREERQAVYSRDTNGYTSPANEDELNGNNGSRESTQINEESSNGRSMQTAVMSSAGGSGNGNPNGTRMPISRITDFFSPEVFHVVLKNPTTAHRLMRFAQSRACGENMEFLQIVDRYTRLLDDISQLLGTVHQTYVSPEAARQINLPYSETKRISTSIKRITQHTMPALESVFDDARAQIERLISSDIYPRFVKHQVTASATMALADHRERFQGLGDCFCMTDPRIADNPILYASDGFVAVTGYSRKDIIPRNCRFLQGEMTDPGAPKRLKVSIEDCEETVELLLNYRKNGDPFWNLLYVSPLFNQQGDVAFFLGGQINCSTTIHSYTDILKILSVNDDELDNIDQNNLNPGRAASLKSQGKGANAKSSFFKSWKKYNSTHAINQRRHVARDEAGMEGELVNRLGKLNLRTQIEAFYTAYSKYIVMEFNPLMQTLLISHYSPGVIDMLCLHLPNGTVVPIYNRDIFKVLSEFSSSSASRAKDFSNVVKDALREGRAVSVETNLLTGFVEKKTGGGWFGGGDKDIVVRVDEKYVTHWTPLKDKEGRVSHVVLTIAPKD